MATLSWKENPQGRSQKKVLRYLLRQLRLESRPQLRQKVHLPPSIWLVDLQLGFPVLRQSTMAR